MIGRNDAATICAHWQVQIDESLEAGDALLIELGVSQRALPELPSLVALEALVAKRTDFAIPWLLAGGDGVIWMAALLSTAVGGGAAQSPAIIPLYGGADQATYIATLATLPGVARQLPDGSATSNATDLPIALHSLLLPTTQPGVAPRWLSLPFVLLEQASTSVSNGETVGGETVTASQDLWVQWLTLFTVIGLLIFSLFI